MSQELYKHLEEAERKNPQKKQGNILIKTMKRHRTMDLGLEAKYNQSEDEF